MYKVFYLYVIHFSRKAPLFGFVSILVADVGTCPPQSIPPTSLPLLYSPIFLPCVPPACYRTLHSVYLDVRRLLFVAWSTLLFALERWCVSAGCLYRALYALLSLRSTILVNAGNGFPFTKCQEAVRSEFVGYLRCQRGWCWVLDVECILAEKLRQLVVNWLFVTA
jgi:hypothetical protein